MLKKIKCKDYCKDNEYYSTFGVNRCIYDNQCEVGVKYRKHGCDGKFIIPQFVKIACPRGVFLSIEGVEVDTDKCDYEPWKSSHDDFRSRCSMKCKPRAK